jgi:hypothetical protein
MTMKSTSYNVSCCRANLATKGVFDLRNHFIQEKVDEVAPAGVAGGGRNQQPNVLDTDRLSMKVSDDSNLVR